MRGWKTLAALALTACADKEGSLRPPGAKGLALASMQPSTVLPGTRMALTGSSFPGAPHAGVSVRLRGELDGQPVHADLAAVVEDSGRMYVDIGPQTSALLGATEGTFAGTAAAVVEWTLDGEEQVSPAIDVSIEFRTGLAPALDVAPTDGAIYVNSELEVSGSGYLLGGGEGVTFAVLEGCVVPAGGAACGPTHRTEVPAEPHTPFGRTRSVFRFAPQIAGIRPGRFEGQLHLENVLSSGEVSSSAALAVSYDLVETAVLRVAPEARVGQYLDIRGGGFVGDDDGTTYLQLQGAHTFDDPDAGVADVDLAIVPQFVGGDRLRYVVNEHDALGLALEGRGGVRYGAGRFEGVMQPAVTFGSQSVTGLTTPITFRIRPVKQVVWVQFTAAYVESLRLFGMRALDLEVRQRVFDVLRRDYQTINVEFREQRPSDFAEYTIVEIGGPDPNDLGLLGYDNTPGKDVGNRRLHDRIGGVNAITQELDGFPGYGGVFIESLMAFSRHPPPGTPSSTMGNALFDAIFDEFRPDRGRPADAADADAARRSALATAAACPAPDRSHQAACAVWVLGSLVGTTASHEFGHALGLADPTNPHGFHNVGDGERRLMDVGANRTFEERAELRGRGPSVFCDEAYAYLRRILPTGAAPTQFARPGC